jgi:predicted neuraminidase
MDNGNWIMAGRMALEIGELPLIPAVLISNGDDLAGDWRIVKLQEEKLPPGNCPETTLWVSENELIAFTRSNGKQPHLYTSRNFGRDWKPVNGHDLFINTSKPYAGTLSTGQHYLIFNAPIPGENGWNQRGALAIALTDAGGERLVKAWKVREANGLPHSYHYPSAIEHHGNLYIVYTASFKDYRLCELAVLPVKSLENHE